MMHLLKFSRSTIQIRVLMKSNPSADGKIAPFAKEQESLFSWRLLCNHQYLSFRCSTMKNPCGNSFRSFLKTGQRARTSFGRRRRMPASGRFITRIVRCFQTSTSTSLWTGISCPASRSPRRSSRSGRGRRPRSSPRRGSATL